MIVRSRAPLRLGFAGGGTDICEYCNVYGGYVLNATINMYAYCTIEERNDNRLAFYSLDRQESVEYHLEDGFRDDGILNLHKGVYERIINDYCDGERLAINIYTHSDAPAGSGLGSSSTMVVAIVKAFVEYLNLPLGEYDIAHLAYEIERLDLHLSGGKQDQYAATFGGFNFIEFYKDDRVIVNPLRVKNWIINELESSIVMYNTGICRDSANIIDDQIANIKKSERTVQAMHALKEDAVRMKEALLKGNIFEFARVLDHSWEAKKDVSRSISNSYIDKVYAAAKDVGAYAGKVSGAGGGGFIMLICDPKYVPEVVRTLNKFEGIAMRPQFVQDGTRGWKIY